MVRTSRLLLATALGLVVAAFFAFDLGRFIDLASLAEKKEAIDAYRAAHPVASALGYFAVYVAVAGLSVPGAVPLTLAGSAIFGFVPALLLVSFASSIGATLAFLAARFLFRDWVQERLGDRLATLNAGMDRDGAFYLFAIRLTPVVPFWIVNLAMGLTPMRASTFYWVSQLGMLPGTAVFVYAGTQLGTFRASWGLLAALVLLGIAPLGARRLVRWLRTRRVYARWAHLRPSRFDYNMVVIGGGSAGLVSAYIAATTQARVALVERERMGGDCLNTGCVPSKALLRSARLLADIGRARELGVAQASARVDFAAVMDRVARVIQTIEPHDSVERYTAMGVEVLHGHATVTSPWTVQVAGGEGARTLTTRAIVIATGARPFVPPIPGLDEVGYYTSNTIWTLR
ncbi:MAG: VTT domain-containing protein, partial [Vicinamibacterales bacterium]